MAMYKMTINIEVAEDFGTFQALELKILEASRTAGREVLRQVFLDYQHEALGKRSVQKRDQRSKKFETMLGVIEFKRWRVFDVFERKHVYPVDEWLGLKPYQKVSPGLLENIIEQSVQRPYGQAATVCTKLSGVKRTAMGNWKLVQCIAKQRREERNKFPDWSQQSLPVLLANQQDACPMLGMDPDATYVRPRKKIDKNHEIKMAVLYTCRKATGKKPRWALAQKQVVIGAVREGAGALFNRVTDKAVNEYGLHSGTRVITHGDGDAWIKQFPESYCPQALLRLDPYHVFEKIRMATGFKRLPKAWIKDFYTRPRALIQKLENLSQELAEPAEIEKVDQVIGYLKNNLKGMEPSGVPKEIKQQFPRMYLRGSGTIESNIFQSICQRFKGRRMLWSEHGLNHLILLREEYLNRSFNFTKVSVPRNHYRKMSYMEELKEIAKDL